MVTTKIQNSPLPEFCCVPGNGGTQVFRQLSAYHGEIAVDPTDGSILRLVVAADLKRSDPIVRSDILVEYGGVEIGGEIYICPVKSISISRAPALPPNAYEMARYRGELVEQGKQTLERLQTSLNEVVFEQYHLFGSDARVLTGDQRGAARESGCARAHGGGRCGLAGRPREEHFCNGDPRLRCSFGERFTGYVTGLRDRDRCRAGSSPDSDADSCGPGD